MSKSEKVIQTQIIKWLESQPNTFVFKTIQCNKNGIPDVIACINGYFVGIEVKREVGGVVSEVQKYQIKNIKEANGIAFVARSLDEVKHEIERIL